MKVAPAWIAFSLLAGCGQSDSRPSNQEIEAYVEVESRKLVAQKLKDPGSAEFSDVRVSWKSGNPMTCGSVNARNGFGGKTGSQRFISNGGGEASLEEEMQAGEFDKVANRYC